VTLWPKIGTDRQDAGIVGARCDDPGRTTNELASKTTHAHADAMRRRDDFMVLMRWLISVLFIIYGRLGMGSWGVITP
jgi:hypothetical protein